MNWHKCSGQCYCQITEDKWCIPLPPPSSCSGGLVVHSYGRLIPFELPITDLQQISGPDGIGRITCTDSSGPARFLTPSGSLITGGVSQTTNGTTAKLEVNLTGVVSFENRDAFCNDAGISYTYLFLSDHGKCAVRRCWILKALHVVDEYFSAPKYCIGVLNVPIHTTLAI